YLRDFLKNSGVIMPILVKNIVMTGISKMRAKGSVNRNINLKYFSTVNNSLNIPSLSEIKNGRIKFIKIKYPNTSPKTNKMKTIGMYAKDTFCSDFVRPGFTNNHICKHRMGNVRTIAISPAIVK